MKRYIVFALTAVFLAILAAPVATAEAGGRHRGGGFFFSSGGFGVSSGHGGPSFFIGRSNPGFSFFLSSGPRVRHGYGRHYGGRGYNRHGYGRHYGRPDHFIGPPDRHYGRPYGRGYERGYNRGYRRGYNRGYGRHGPPVTRFWVPGRKTPRGYAAGYWDYRTLDRGPSGRRTRAPY
jgi:hypothetical protein